MEAKITMKKETAELRERFHIGNERNGKLKGDLTLSAWKFARRLQLLAYLAPGVGVIAQRLLGFGFVVNVNHLADVTTRNLWFLKSSPGIIFFYVQ